MIKSIIYKCLFLFAVTLAIPTFGLQSAKASSPFDPAPVGTKLSGIIECGRGYTTHELYNIKITLLKVIRGDKTWEHLRKAGNSQKTIGPDFDYILARIKFEYYARGKPGLCVHKLTPIQFTACSVEGEDYPAADVILPKPEMQGNLTSGDSIEGWVAFRVPKTDEKPMLYYSADSGKAVLHGGNIWFKLY